MAEADVTKNIGELEVKEMIKVEGDQVIYVP